MTPLPPSGSSSPDDESLDRLIQSACDPRLPPGQLARMRARLDEALANAADHSAAGEPRESRSGRHVRWMPGKPVLVPIALLTAATLLGVLVYGRSGSGRSGSPAERSVSQVQPGRFLEPSGSRAEPAPGKGPLATLLRQSGLPVREYSFATASTILPRGFSWAVDSFRLIPGWRQEFSASRSGQQLRAGCREVLLVGSCWFADSIDRTLAITPRPQNRKAARELRQLREWADLRYRLPRFCQAQLVGLPEWSQQPAIEPWSSGVPVPAGIAKPVRPMQPITTSQPSVARNPDWIFLARLLCRSADQEFLPRLLVWLDDPELGGEAAAAIQRLCDDATVALLVARVGSAGQTRLLRLLLERQSESGVAAFLSAASRLENPAVVAESADRIPAKVCQWLVRIGLTSHDRRVVQAAAIALSRDGTESITREIVALLDSPYSVRAACLAMAGRSDPLAIAARQELLDRALSRGMMLAAESRWQGLGLPAAAPFKPLRRPQA